MAAVWTKNALLMSEVREWEDNSKSNKHSLQAVHVEYHL